jgi:hypothetical protein
MQRHHLTGASTDVGIGATFGDPPAAVAGGMTLVPAGVLAAAALLLHPLPSSGGFEESAGQLAGTPLWGAVHFAITAGFVLCLVGGLLVLISGGPMRTWPSRFAWAATVDRYPLVHGRGLAQRLGHASARRRGRGGR